MLLIIFLQAVKFAAHRDFDIISISWTILKLERGAEGENADDIDELNKGLQTAVNNGILVFCSAPDSGDLSPDQFNSFYPVGSTITSKFFKIGAGKGDGSPWGRTGGKRNVDYILPGGDVREK